MLYRDFVEPFKLDFYNLFAMETFNHLEIFEVFDIFSVNEVVDVIIGVWISGVEAPILPSYVERVLRVELLSKKLDHLQLISLPRSLILMSELNHQFLVSVLQ